ncbi:unnamed protein product [Ectocarpus sp. CCAP 1310/34]|nr:unnamed protein product [Ectocarpus sp. CCAP 1310/34]
MFMCKTRFNTVPLSTREGWKQYRGTRTFPESRIAASCRPGPTRGHGAAAAAAAAASEVDPGHTNHPDDEKGNRGPTNSALWPGKVYNVLYQVWNAQAEQKKISSGDGYMTSSDRAALVPQAANVLRDQGHPEMATILDNTTEGARKVIRSRVLAKYLKNREVFSAKLRNIGLDPTEIAEWDVALVAAQHHADLAPRERDQPHSAVPLSLPHHSSPHCHQQQEGDAGGVSGGGQRRSLRQRRRRRQRWHPRPLHQVPPPQKASRGSPCITIAAGRQRRHPGARFIIRKKPGRKLGKLNKSSFNSPEAKRARVLDSIVSAAERSILLQEAGAEHMRRLVLADAEQRLTMEKEEHALRMAIGKSALALLSKMAGEPPPQLSPPPAPPTPTPPPTHEPGSVG